MYCQRVPVALLSVILLLGLTGATVYGPLEAATHDSSGASAASILPALSGNALSGAFAEEPRTHSEGPAQEDPLLRPAGRTLAASRKSELAKRRPTRGAAYLSIGRVRSFTGDVYPSPSLALALENRSYRRELILITDTRPRAALQLYYNLAQLGLVHVLWLTSSYASCASMAQLASARDELVRQRQALQAQLAAQAAAAAAASGASAGGGSGAARRLRDADGGDGAAGAAAAASGGPVSVSVYSAAAALAEAYINSAPDSADTALSTDDLMGCAWYGQPFPPGFTGHRRLMMKRIMLMARAVRMGYNVLSLDTDVIVFRDPYPLLKVPPYGAVQMLVGKSVRSGGVANTGVMYVHGAARDGPVAWLLGEVVDRNLRWVEHNVSMPHMAAAAAVASTGAPASGVLRLMPPQADSRGCWDQFLFGDVVLTGATGKLVLLYCARPVGKGRGRGSAGTGEAAVGTAAAAGAGEGAGAGGRRAEDDGGWTARHFAAMKLANQQNPVDVMKRESISVADKPALAALVGAKSFTSTTVHLSIPRDPAPLLQDEPGYALPGLKPGGAAEAFQRVLRDDAVHAESRGAAAAASGADAGASAGQRQQRRRGGSRLLLQGGAGGMGMEAASGAGAAAAGAAASNGTERLAYAADWLVGGWPQRGVLGYWDPELTNRKPKQVFAHLVRAPGPTNLGKDAVRMQYGEYDWELAALAAGGPFPFLGSPEASEAPRVVALHPDVDTSTYSQLQWTNMARGLAQVALLTGRRVAWPSVPCDSGWVQPNPGSRRALPLNMNLRFLTHGSFAGGLTCTPASVLHQKCLYTRHVVQRNDTAHGEGADAEDGGGGPEYTTRVEGPRGLLPPEFALLRRLLPAETEPGPHNTVHLQTNDDYEDGDGGERPVMFDEPPRAKGVVYVKASAVLQPLRDGPLARERVLYLAQRTFVTQLDKLGDAELMAKYRAFRNECPALK